MPDTPRPLDRMQQIFDLVARHGLCLDGAALGHGLPARAIALGELRGLLLHPGTPPAARDAALAVLVTRARGGDERWRIGLVGVLLPGLRAAAGRLGHRFPGERADLEAEVLAGLAEAIGVVPLERGGLAGRLVYAAMKRGHRLLRAEWTEHTNRANASASAAPVRPWSHPDLVLVDAVEAGVISAPEAELIGATRLERVPLRDLAARGGAGFHALRQRRLRAERRLVAWIRTGETDGLSQAARRARIGGVRAGRGRPPGSPRREAPARPSS